MRHRISTAIAVFMFLTTTALVAQPSEGQKGDANNDGSINVLDMLTIANHILGIATLDEQGLWRADLNGPVGDCDGDGSADVLDMVKIANIILGNDECSTITVTDIDGNVYQTVTIGGQVWMAENLKVTHYRNGDSIPPVRNNSEWASLTTGARCDYDNDTDNVPTYGRLYNWYAVNDSRGIAPEDWHVPSDDDWKQLEMYLGMSQSEADDTGYRGTDEGGKLKSTGTIEGGDGLWCSPNTGATNSSGFSALPGGYRFYYFGYFYLLGNYAYFWSSTEYGSYPAWRRVLTCYSSGVGRNDNTKRNGFSVRCVRD